MTGIIVDVRNYVMAFEAHVTGHNLNDIEQRLIISALMESAFNNATSEREIMHLVEVGVINNNASLLYSVLRRRHAIHLLQYNLNAMVTEIAWNCFRNKAMTYSVSVESGKVLISERNPCLTRSPSLPAKPSRLPKI